MNYDVEFALTDDSDAPLVVARVSRPTAEGIQRIRLSDYGVRLVANRKYRWFVSLIADPERRSRDILCGGTVIRIEPAEEVSKRLAQSNDKERIDLYADQGIWYDAIQILSELIESKPHDKALRETRASLMEQVGLGEVAAFDLKQ